MTVAAFVAVPSGETRKVSVNPYRRGVGPYRLLQHRAVLQNLSPGIRWGARYPDCHANELLPSRFGNNGIHLLWRLAPAASDIEALRNSPAPMVRPAQTCRNMGATLHSDHSDHWGLLFCRSQLSENGRLSATGLGTHGSGRCLQLS